LFESTKKESSAWFFIDRASVVAFKVLLSYFYEGNVKLQPGELPNAVIGACFLARRFGLHDLSSRFWAALTLRRSTLAVGNTLDRLDTARFYRLEDQKNACLAFFDEHAVEVFEDASFLNLTEVSSKCLICTSRYSISH
jgi:hypothetical protein